MRLQALNHVVTAVRALTQCERVLVMGSASLLVAHDELGIAGGPLELTRDADLLIDPTHERLAKLVHEAIGQGSLFETEFGYYADLLHPNILTSLPSGWDARALAGQDADFRSLHPLDVAAVKLVVARPKDLAVVRVLLDRGWVSRADLRDVMAELPCGEHALFAALRRLHALAGP